MTLPLEHQAPTATPVEPDPEPLSLGGVHVLVVDDDDDSREMLIAALEYSGGVVRGAQSVAHARKELAAHLPDIVIGDVGMPEEDGYHFVEELRRRPAAEGVAFRRSRSPGMPGSRTSGGPVRQASTSTCPNRSTSSSYPRHRTRAGTQTANGVTAPPAHPHAERPAW